MLRRIFRKLHSINRRFSRDNLIGAPRESRLKGASRDSKARVATQRRESRLKGASRDSKARLNKNTIQYNTIKIYLNTVKSFSTKENN